MIPKITETRFMEGTFILVEKGTVILVIEYDWTGHVDDIFTGSEAADYLIGIGLTNHEIEYAQNLIKEFSYIFLEA